MTYPYSNLQDAELQAGINRGLTMPELQEIIKKWNAKRDKEFHGWRERAIEQLRKMK